jgi:CHAD domain-containing protein
MAGQKGESRRWLPGLKREMPLADAAGVAITVRLGEALARLHSPATAAGDPDAVRRLRVALRRASVTLKAFVLCLPADEVRRLRRRMNRIRRVAGRLRDCDVQMGMAAAVLVSGPEEAHEAAEFALDRLRRIRRRRSRRLRRAIVVKRPKIERSAQRVLSASAGRFNIGGESTEVAGYTLRDAAALALGASAEEALKLAERNLTCEPMLHEFRIACRRLRYGLELFASVLPPRFREDLYPILIETQDRIGRAGDTALFAKRLRRLARRGGRAGKKLRAQLLELAQRQRALQHRQVADAANFALCEGKPVLQEIGALIRNEAGWVIQASR